jgi:hypothetical protein
MFRLDSNFLSKSRERSATSTVLHFWMEVDDLIGRYSRGKPNIQYTSYNCTAYTVSQFPTNCTDNKQAFAAMRFYDKAGLMKTRMIMATGMTVSITTSARRLPTAKGPRRLATTLFPPYYGATATLPDCQSERETH